MQDDGTIIRHRLGIKFNLILASLTDNHPILSLVQASAKLHLRGGRLLGTRFPLIRGKLEEFWEGNVKIMKINFQALAPQDRLAAFPAKGFMRATSAKIYSNISKPFGGEHSPEINT